MDGKASLARWAASRHGVFTRTEAHDRGVSNKRLRRMVEVGEADQLSRSVFGVPGFGDPTLKPMMAAVSAIPGSAVAARSACTLHGLGGSPAGKVDLWIPERARRKSLGGVRILRNEAIVAHCDLIRVGSIRSVSPTVALMQVGAWVDDLAVEHCLDDFLRKHDEAWLRADLLRFGRSGRPGIGALRRVLNAPHRVIGVTDSWMERLLANLASVPGLPPLELQVTVTIGGKTYRIDVGFPTIRLGLEAHSRTFHFGPQKENADNVRDIAFASAGWQLLYLTWQQIHDPDGFALQLGEIARRRALDLGLAS